jgi:ATP-dependent DNA helicase RecG
MLTADTPLRFLKGVGPARADKLVEVGIETVEDLLYVLPFRWEDRRSFSRIADLRPGGAETTLDVTVASARLIRTRRRGFTIFHALLKDASGTIKAVFYNQPFLQRVFVPGRRVVVFGRATLDRYGKEVILENPDHEGLDDADAEGIHTGRIVPVYRKLADLSSRMQRLLIWRAIEQLDPGSLRDTVPGKVLARQHLPGRLDALRDVHFPPPDAALRDLDEHRTPAQRALAFEEIFLLQLALAMRRREVERERRSGTYVLDDALRRRLAALLPFKLTAAQQRVLKEIGEDLRSPHPMNRLLQGDVGSGKTIVALMALLVAVENGYQGALMAPTEILAEQHWRNVGRLLASKGADYRVELLTGSMKAARRRSVLEGLATGGAHLVVGTHALFEKGVVFRRLGMVVVDEQHRFGVLQRAALASKGSRPDVLVMTATPIPRSLALTLYGDLELSTIDELPPGRTPITTVVRGEGDREKVYAGIRKEIAAGHQAYVVVPLVEETEKSDLKAATAFAAHLQEIVFPDLKVGLLHGKMKSDEKERTMARFTSGELHVLVATTVVEVGVDVPNASVMVVEHAERFGLAQLHQLRGRVGRGAARSFCVLMVGEGEGFGVARERLEIMTQTNDGFRISERDLELRGPGAVFGTQQHGMTDLQFLADVLRDSRLLETARDEAKLLVNLEGDAGAETLLATLRPSWRRRLGLAGVG